MLLPRIWLHRAVVTVVATVTARAVARVVTAARAATNPFANRVLEPAWFLSGGSFFINIHLLLRAKTYNMLSIADIVDAVAFPFSVWRTLGGLAPEMRDGRPVYVAGNAAVSFRVTYRGERKMLKCYTRTNENLKAIYGAAYRANELCVIDMESKMITSAPLDTPTPYPDEQTPQAPQPEPM